MKAICMVTAVMTVFICVNECGLSLQVENEAAPGGMATPDLQTTLKSDDPSDNSFDRDGNPQGREIGSAEEIKDLQKLIRQVEAYVAVNPDWKNEAWMVRAVAYMKTGNSDQLNALISYSDGVDAAAAGKYVEALMRYEEAIRLDPLFPWSANNLAWVLSTCRDEKLRDGRRAVEFARQAVKVPEVEVPDFINTLAAAYAAAGDFDSAVRLCRKSVEMWPREVFKEMLGCYLDKTLYIAHGPSARVGEFVSAEGCGRAKWGMSKLDVLEVLPESAMKDNDVVLARRESERGYRTTMVLHFRYDMLYRVQVVASGIREADIEPDFIKEASAGKGTFKKAEIAAGADRTAAVWESDETRVEILYSRSKSEAVMDFVSKRFEQLSPTQAAERQNL
jgi:tetratricopeptide (TPR) repeat protein